MYMGAWWDESRHNSNLNRQYLNDIILGGGHGMNWANWTVVTTKDDNVHLYNDYTVVKKEEMVLNVASTHACRAFCDKAQFGRYSVWRYIY
jgi:hypothetical protein